MRLSTVDSTGLHEWDLHTVYSMHDLQWCAYAY